METKTILIAETHKEQAEFFKNALKNNEINVTILDVETTNSKEMEEAILKLKPDIVFTNEKKSDRPATDVIKNIQSNIEQHQPIFIISSGYTTEDIDSLCREKGICAYSVQKPFDDDILAKEIESIINNEDITKLNKHLYFSFSKENLDIVNSIMECRAGLYIYDPEYKQINHELSELHEEIQKAPKRIREKFRRFEYLQGLNNIYENSFIYQYLKNPIQK